MTCKLNLCDNRQGYLNVLTSAVRDVHWTPIGMCISDGKTDGGFRCVTYGSDPE